MKKWKETKEQRDISGFTDIPVSHIIADHKNAQNNKKNKNLFQKSMHILK